MRRLPLLSLACLTLLPGCNDGDTPKAPARSAAAKDGDRPAKISDKCDATKLTALTGSLAAAAPAKGPELVAKHLGDACELPDAFASFFALSAPIDEDNLPDGTLANAGKDAHEALTKICAGATVINKQLAAEAGDARQGLLYDRCDFKRFGLMDKGAWLKGEPTSPVPFFAYDWLVEQGIATADAKALAKAMILRDRKRWSRKDQELPTLAYALADIPQGTTVHITPTYIMVNDAKIATLAEGKVEASALRGHLIGPLFDVLAEEADKNKSIATAAGGAWSGTAVLVADASVPQRTLIDVMYSAGRAEFGRYAFVAQSGPFEYGAVLVEPPKFGANPKPGAAPDLSVHISADGFRVRASNSDGEPTHIPMTDGAKPDFAALTAAAAAHTKANPEATVARVSADDETSFGTLVEALATLNGARLPELVVGANATGAFEPTLIARNAGILGMLAQESGHFLASPYGSAFADGETEDVWGGLTDTEVGEAFGVGAGGLGLTGVGAGEGTIGLGNVGLIGKGGGGGSGSGYGRGSGTGFGGSGKKVPRVRQAKATVTGSLDKDIIRRIVRAHINEVRYCYNQGLVKDPELEGRVSVDFVIGGTGKVTSSSVAKDTLGDESVGKCIAKAVKRWKFPKPTGGGEAKVRYPFVLSPG